MHRTIIFLLLLFPAIASAGWINKAGEPLPDSDSQKSVGDFGAQLIFVGDENELFKSWATPSETIDVKTSDKVEVNEAINAFIIFSGCRPDKQGNCNVSMRFRVLQPDGKVYADTPPMEVWHEKPAPRGRSLGLSVQYLKLRIEPKDKLGKYIVHAQVRDNHTETVLQLQAPFIAKKVK
ncbi:hypothetical protein [Methylovulum miyakonense]|uniref:hypothetical protein n=1 Tax=Methylovulum miyakonense TaxID=645578 RepID=UPI0012EB15F2|nr:hypothetical protein [Methylovulum miyakonense]